MIIYSTPGSITWENHQNKSITFQGEWTLEPKFYLDVPKMAYWNNTSPPIGLSNDELQDAISSLLKDAEEKGWVIEMLHEQ